MYDSSGLRIGREVTDPESGLSYKIQELLGRGGFGVAYRCLDPRGKTCCLKFTKEQESWHTEAYMGRLLRGQARVLQVYDTFPILWRSQLEGYAVILELAEGTVEDAVEADGAWSERKVVREGRALLSALQHLHDGGALHRDLTPRNVFVCGATKRLKLGDFGIATHGPPEGVPANQFAPWFVDPAIRAQSKKHWTVGEDLWQLGQILAVLLTGEVRPIGTREVKDLKCSDATKVVIRRAIGEHKVQYSSAEAMAAALRGTSARFGLVRSLDGKGVVLTGPMSTKRSVATRRAEHAGATVYRSMSRKVDVVVVGDQSPHYIAGSQGLKLLEAEALKEQGVGITIITERSFLKLVSRGHR